MAQKSDKCITHESRRLTVMVGLNTRDRGRAQIGGYGRPEAS
jgi:hypothetical protein